MPNQNSPIRPSYKEKEGATNIVRNRKKSTNFTSNFNKKEDGKGLEPIEKIDQRTWKGTFIYLACLAAAHGSFIIFFYLLYLGVTQEIYWLLILLGLSQIYQFSPYCKRSQWLLDFIQLPEMYKYFKNYTCEFEEPMQETNSLLTAHPHGVLDVAFILNGNTFYKTTGIGGSRAILSIPFNGMVLKWFGVVQIDPQSLKKTMESGKNIGILPGGFEEATLTSKRECRIFIKKRKGFIKYALQYGYNIYPMFVFGENQLYNTFEPFLKQRLMFNKFKLPGVIFWSKNILYADNRQSLHTVVGKGWKLPKIENPSKEEVDEYHQIYIEKVKEVFYKYRGKYHEKSDLHIY